MAIRSFEWDRDKASTNQRKHGVTFDEAATAFDDRNLRREYDGKHAHDEDRWLIIGFSARLRLLTVIYAISDETIRLITARRSTKAEKGRYVERR